MLIIPGDHIAQIGNESSLADDDLPYGLIDRHGKPKRFVITAHPFLCRRLALFIRPDDIFLKRKIVQNDGSAGTVYFSRVTIESPGEKHIKTHVIDTDVSYDRFTEPACDILSLLKLFNGAAYFLLELSL